MGKRGHPGVDDEGSAEAGVGSDPVAWRLGTHRGFDFRIRGRVDDPADTTRDFAVVVFTRHRGDTIQVVRVDDSHGFTHIDRLYRRDAPKERVDWGFWEAVSRLSTDWRRYAERHPVTD